MVTESDLEFLNECIQFVSDTEEGDWCTDVVRRVEGDKKRNCFFGHLFHYYATRYDETEANRRWTWFESVWATTFQIYHINDGGNPDYPQPTPKQRILKYLENLRDGVEPDIETINNETIREMIAKGLFTVKGK